MPVQRQTHPLGALATAVTTLWKTVENKNTKAITILESQIVNMSREVEECEKSKAEMREKISDLNHRIQDLERRLSRTGESNI